VASPNHSLVKFLTETAMPDGTVTVAQTPEDLRTKVNAQVVDA
jgi:hypothetical protein